MNPTGVGVDRVHVGGGVGPALGIVAPLVLRAYFELAIVLVILGALLVWQTRRDMLVFQSAPGYAFGQCRHLPVPGLPAGGARDTPYRSLLHRSVALLLAGRCVSHGG